MSGWLGDLELDDLCTKYNIDVIYTTDIDEQEKIIIDIVDSISTGILYAATPFVDDYVSIKDEFLGRKYLYIDSLYIDTQFRNKGIGSMVLRYIIDELSDLGSIITVLPNLIELDDTSEEYRAVFKRLITLYEVLGFKSS